MAKIMSRISYILHYVQYIKQPIVPIVKAGLSRMPRLSRLSRLLIVLLALVVTTTAFAALTDNPFIQGIRLFDAERQLYSYHVTNSTAISESVAPGFEFLLQEVRLTANATMAAENFTITLDSQYGTSFDHLISSTSTDGVSSVTWVADHDIQRLFGAADALDFALANSNNVKWGLEVLVWRVR